jgi:hypothetical protein
VAGGIKQTLRFYRCRAARSNRIWASIAYVATIVEVIRYQIVEGQETAFEDAYRQSQQYLTDPPHCWGYELTRRRKSFCR